MFAQKISYLLSHRFMLSVLKKEVSYLFLIVWFDIEGYVCYGIKTFPVCNLPELRTMSKWTPVALTTGMHAWSILFFNLFSVGERKALLVWELLWPSNLKDALGSVLWDSYEFPLNTNSNFFFKAQNLLNTVQLSGKCSLTLSTKLDKFN